MLILKKKKNMRKKIMVFCALLTFLFGHSQSPADIDITFNYINGTSGGSLGSGSFINSIVAQSDGKILMGGKFGKYNNITKYNLARLNNNGAIDISFLLNPDNQTINFEIILNDYVTSIALLNDGKILVGGKFTSSQFFLNRVMYLNTDGTFLTTVGSGANNNVFCVASDINTGYTYFGGNFKLVNGDYSNYISGKNSAYNQITGGTFTNFANNTVSSIAVQPNGKLIVGGNFTSYSGVARNFITRLNNNLTLDATFNSIGTGFQGYNGSADQIIDCHQINSIIVQPNGKILVGGNFTTYNGIARTSIARLNSDGTLDTSFNPVIEYERVVTTIALQSNGKILIGGNFISINGIARNSIARLNSDGTLDTSFDPGLGISGYVKTIALQSDSKILVGGLFDNYNGTPRNNIVRLYGDSVLGIENQSLKDINIYPNPAKDKFTIDFGNELISNYTIKINNLLGQEVYSNFIDKPQFEVGKTWQGEGMYFVKILNAQNKVVNIKKIILQ